MNCNEQRRHKLLWKEIVGTMLLYKKYGVYTVIVL